MKQSAIIKNRPLTGPPTPLAKAVVIVCICEQKCVGLRMATPGDSVSVWATANGGVAATCHLPLQGWRFAHRQSIDSSPTTKCEDVRSRSALPALRYRG
jgi:hypothetical protein